MTNHELYMHRCLELAQNGLGRVAPNPLVGCVIVHKDTIIGEGFHGEFGGPHAEINALNSVSDKTLLPESTLYVNLEPCCHHGKTPPCTDRIIAEGIGKVVIGMQDPFPEVSGKGIQMLKQAGVEVVKDILEKECRWINRRFIRFYDSKRPYIILKWAQTIDGFIDKKRTTDDAGINWITNEHTRMLVHKWRTQEQGVMIGANTAIKDNPRLTAREWAGRNPLRVVVDKTNELNGILQIFNREAETLVFNGSGKIYGNTTRTIKTDFSEDPLPFIFKTLFEQNIQSVMVEGGRQLATSVISSGLWDEARIFTGNCCFVEGIEAPEISGTKHNLEHIGEDVLTTFINFTF